MGEGWLELNRVRVWAYLLHFMSWGCLVVFYDAKLTIMLENGLFSIIVVAFILVSLCLYIPISLSLSIVVFTFTFTFITICIPVSILTVFIILTFPFNQPLLISLHLSPWTPWKQCS